MIASFLFKKNIDSHFLWLYFILCCLLGIAQIFFSQAQLFLFINQFVSSKIDFIFFVLTWLGSGWAYAVVCLLILFFQKKYFWLSVISFAATGLIAQAIKYLIPQNPRPLTFFSSTHTTIKISNLAEQLHWESFPSGHTTSAFSMCLLLSYIFKKEKWSFFFFVMALFIGISRVYLTAHFVKDIFAGMILGTEITALIIVFFQQKFENDTK